MPIVQLFYTVAERTDRELRFDHPTDTIEWRDITRAIFKQETGSDVDPFPEFENVTSQKVLAEIKVTNVSVPGIIVDEAGDDPKPG